MNRNYKVIWNEALGCFTAVAEYAKARGKSSQSSVSSNASINTTSNTSSIGNLRLGAIGIGLLVAGFGIPVNASTHNSTNGNSNHHEGTYSHSHGSHGSHTHTNGNNSHNNNSNPSNPQNPITLNFEGDNPVTIARSNGQTLNILGGQSDESKLSNSANIGVIGDADTLTIKLAKDLTGLDSASFSSGVILSPTGIHAGNKKITNVDNGSAPKDAVNVSQLTSTIAANKTKYYSVNSTGGNNELNDGATGANSLAMGRNARSIGSQTIAIGSVSSGQDTTALGEQSIAIGANVVTKGGSSIAIGGDDLDAASKTNIDGSPASGTLNGGTVNAAFNEYAGRDLLDPSNRYVGHTEAGGAASIAIGAKARSAGNLATAMGIHSNAAGTASSAFGVAASATQKGALALGAGAQGLATNGVALGSRSVANRTGGIGFEGFAPTSASTADKLAIKVTNSRVLGAVSVGNTDEGTRQIVNLAAGKSDSDAVNVAQLKGVSNVVNQGLNFGGDRGLQFNRELGQKVFVKGGQTDLTKLSEGNIGVVSNGSNTLNVKLSKDLTDLNSAAFGSVTLSTTGLNNGGNKVTDVANGSDPNDAVNFSQLESLTNTVSGIDFPIRSSNTGPYATSVSGTNALAVGSNANANGNNSTAIGENTKAVGNATVIGEGARSSFNGFAGGQDAKAGVNSVAIGQRATNGNASRVIAIGYEAQATVNDAVALGLSSRTTVAGGVALGNYSIANIAGGATGFAPTAASAADQAAITATNSTVLGAVSIGNTKDGNRQIVNVAAGTTASDAVNVAQLTAVDNQVTTNTGSIDKGIKFNVDGLERTYALGETIGVTTDDNIDVTATIDGAKFSLANVVTIGTDNPVQINGTTGTVSGLTNRTFNPNTVYTGGQAATQEQLNELNTSVTGLGFAVQAADGNTVQKNLGQAVEIVGSNNNIDTRVRNGKVEVQLNNTLDLSNTGSVKIGSGGFLGLGNTSTLNRSGLTTGNSLLNTTVNGLGVRTGNALINTTVTSLGIAVSNPFSTTILSGNGLNIIGGPSVTTTGVNAGNNKIVNVDNGTDPTDAVNVSQLSSAASSAKTELLGGTNTKVTNNFGTNGQNVYTIDTDGTTVSSTDTAALIVTAGTKDLSTNLTDYAIELGADTIASLESADSALQTIITQVDGVDVKTLTRDDNNTNFVSGTNIALSDDGNGGITVATTPDIVATTVTTGNTLLNTGGVTFLGGSTVSLSSTGLDNGNNKLVNVAAGVADTDAVNVAQLTTTNENVAKGFNISAQGSADDNVQLGETVDFTNADGNLVVTNTDNNINYDLAEALTVTQVTTGNGVMNTEGVTFTGGTNQTVILSNNGLNNGNNTITNVTAGVNDTDAANVSQITTAAAASRTEVVAGTNVADVIKTSGINGQDIYTVNANGSTASAGSNAVTVTADTPDDDNVTDYLFDLSNATKDSLVKADNSVQYDNTDQDSVTLGGTSAAAPVTLTNVSPADLSDDSTDAVNGSQLFDTNQNVTTNQVNISTNATDIAKGIKFNVDGLERTYALGETIGVTTDDNIDVTATTDGAKFSLANVVNIGTDNPVQINGTAGTVSGLTNTTFDPNTVYTGGQAATQEQLNELNNGINTTVNQGLNFAGDSGSNVNRQFGDILNLTGGETDTTKLAAGNNIGVTANGTDGLTVQLAKDIELGIDGSVETGNTVVNNAGITITNGPNQTITLSDEGLDNGNNRIIKVAAGIAPSDAVNFEQLTTTNDNVTINRGNISTNTTNIAKGIRFNVDGLERTYALGETIGVTTDDNIDATVTADGAKFSLNTDLTGLNSATFGGVQLSTTGLDNGGNQITKVASGGNTLDNAANIGDVRSAAASSRTEVEAGTNVADVVKTSGINGQDIYTVNANSTSTSAGSTAVTVTEGTKDANNVTDYAVDLSADSKASLVKADTAVQSVVTQIDGTTVKTVDKTDNTANFVTGDNIVLSDDNGSIKVATAEDLVLTSVTTGATLVNDAGMTITGGTNQTITLSNAGLDNGGNKIINVADGEADTDAVNVGQLNATNSTVDMGLNFTGDDTAVVVNRKLGQTLTVKGGATELTDNNIGVVADEDGNLNVKLAKDLTGLNSADFGSGVSLSANGLNNGGNKITNVAEGTTIKDAVNFGQLSATNENVAINTSNITTNTADIGINTGNIAKGIRIGDGDSLNDQQFALGDTINITGDSNLTTTASATGVQVQLNNQLNLGNTGSMQIGNSIMNNTGFTFTNSGSGRTVILSDRGLDNGGNTIRNVGTGTLDSDAVNVGQLRDVTIALDQGWGITAQGDIATTVKQGGSVDMGSRDGNIKVSRTLVSSPAVFDSSTGRFAAAAIPAGANDLSFDLSPDISVVSLTAGDTTIDDNGLTIEGGPSVTKAGIDAADNKITNVQNGSVSTSSQDAINGSQLFAQGTGISSIIGGDTVYNPEDGTFTNSNVGGTGEGSIDGAIASIRQGAIEITENVQTNTTDIETNTTNIETNTSNITTNTTNITSNTGRIDAGLNFGADSGDNINKPVGDESVLSFTGSENITTTAEGSSIKFDLHSNIDVDSVTMGTTFISSEGVSMQGGPSMTTQGLYAGNQRVTGVADGIETTDAVNFGQLDAVGRRLGDNINELGYRIDDVEDDANAGISAAMAMSSLPQAYIIGKSMVGGGIATYNGESAVAVGVSKLSDDGRWVIKVNGTADTQGNFGGAIGAGFHFD